MKLKYQQGGVFTPPFAVYQSSPNPSYEESHTSKDDSEKEEAVMKMKDIYKMFDNLTALPGDKTAIMGTLQGLLDRIEYKLYHPDAFGGVSSISREYLQILDHVSNLKFYHDQFIKARDTAITKNNLSEVAINSLGQVMVISEDGYDWITPEEYAQNQDYYKPITNSELLSYRVQGAGGLALDNISFETVLNSVGMNEITEYINATIATLGNDSSNVNSGYVGVSKGDLLQGITDYAKALEKSGNYNASVQDLYKVKLLNESQARQAQMALQYIYTEMSPAAKSLLKMKTNGQDSGAIKLIGLLINSKLKIKVDFEPNLVGGASHETTSGKDNSETSNPYLQLIREEGGQNKRITIVPDGTNNGLQVNATFYSALPNITEEMSIDALLSTKMLHITGNAKNSISFGDQLLDPSQLKDVMFGNEGAAVTTLPILTDPLGNIKVNMEIVEDFNKVKEKLKEFKHLPEREYNKKYAELLHTYELDELIDQSTGLPDQTKTAQFLMFTAYTTDRVIDSDKKSKFVEKVRNPSEGLQERIIRGLSTDKDKSNYSLDVDDNGIFEMTYDDVYRGCVFIPLSPNPIGALNAGGDKRSENDITEAEQQYQNFVKLINMKPTYE